MASKLEFRRLKTRIAYPWSVERAMPADVTGMGQDEAIYGPSQIAGPSENQDQTNDQTQ